MSAAQVLDHPQQRARYFLDQRRFPHDKVPDGARLRALDVLDAIERSVRTGKIGARATGMQSPWKLIGPQPIDYGSGYLNSGRVAALAIDPRSNDTVYAGAAEGGVWKTTDGGVTWSPLTDDQPSLSTGALALDPSNPDTIYVGTGEEDFSGDSYSGAGILKSTDGGATWTNIPGPFQQHYIGGIAVHPTNGVTVLAASSVGLYRSADAGLTWTLTLAGTATAVFFDPAQPAVAWCALGNIYGAASNGIYRSADAGLTWKLVNGASPNLLPAGNAIGRIQIVNAPSSPDTTYAILTSRVTGPGSALYGVYRTTNAGANWTKLTNVPDFCNPQCWYDLAIASNPTSPNVLLVGGSTTNLRSLDGGTSWQAYTTTRIGTPHADDHAIAFTPDGARLYLANDGGVWSSTAFQSTAFTWNDLNATLALTQYYPSLSIHPTNPQITIAGSQDNGTHLYNGGMTWSQLLGGDGGWTALDASNPTTGYVTVTGISLYRSRQILNPVDLVPVVHGIDQTDRQRFIGSYVMDPNTPQTMYYGTSRIYQSLDGGGLWQAISPDLTEAPSNTSSSDTTYTISTISVSPANSNVIYTGSVSSAVFQTSDGGKTWTDRSGVLPYRSVTRVLADLIDPLTVYVTFSGYASTGDTEPGHIFQSRDGGVSWSDISGNLPNIPVDDLAIDPDLPNTLYAATDAGVMVTTDGGLTWTTLGTGLPRVVVTSLALHRPSRTLRAATHGRSVWDYALAPVSSSQPFITSLSPATVAAGVPQFTLQITGTNLGPNMHVRWNGQDRLVTDGTATTLSVTILASDVAGVGRASIVVFNPSSGGGASVPANFVIGAAPSIKAGGIISAASPLTSAIASPGAIMSLYGANIAGSTISAADYPLPFPLPYTLGGVSVTVGGYPAPLYIVSPGFLNFQVPTEINTRVNQAVVVTQGNQVSSVVSVGAAAVAPAIFSTDTSGSGQGAIRIANSVIVPAPAGTFPGSRPVKAGEYLEIYCTGLGTVSPRVADGAAPLASPLSATVLTPAVSIGNLPAVVTFSGLTPGIAGLYVVDVQVPAGAPSGSAIPVTLTIGGVPSNTVTIAVQ